MPALRVSSRFVALALLSLSFVACGGEERPALREAKGGRKYGGIFRMNEVQDLRSFDPVRINDAPSHHVLHQVCELLLDFDSSLTLQPELAERWEMSPDGKTYTFYLRKGVMFQDSPAFPNGKGREMKASDVKYCFDRLLDNRARTLNAPYFRSTVVGADEYYRSTGGGRDTSKPEEMNAPITPLPGGVAGFRVVDDYTFAIDLVKPLAVFKYYVTLGAAYIYPKEAVEKFKDDYGRNPVGTGPFIFERWNLSQELVLKRNPNYWRVDEHGNRLPYLDGIHWTFHKDEGTQLTELREGNLEEAYRIPSELFTSVVDTSGTLTPEYSHLRLHKVPAMSSQYYGMLTTAPPFNDKRVRQAFNYAVDRDQIVKYVLQGQAFGPSTHGFVPPSIPGYDISSIKGYTFDIDKARALMAEAGYPDGKGFPPIDLQLNSGGGRNALVANAVQNMLTKGLGVQVGLKELEWAQHQEQIEAGKAPFFRLGWIADYPDPETFLTVLYGKVIPESGPSSINSTRWANAQFDSLYEAAQGVSDDAQRFALYRQAEQIAADEAPMLWIFNDTDYRLVQPWVYGYASNAMDRRDLTAVWIDYTEKTPA